VSRAADPGRPTLSIVVPALDEADAIATTVAGALAHADEVVVVDGGSRDATGDRARAAGAIVVDAPRGRASQMNAGAARACGEVLLFLHADCRLPAGAGDAVRGAIAAGRRWGRFDVRLQSARPALAVIGGAMNLRSRLTGIATGDQAIFVTRSLWDAVDGFAPIPLMEDVELTARLRRLGPPACLRLRVDVSARRWERHGVVRTVLLMWGLRAAYALGASPQRLHRVYYGPR
jgi:rSAM/selenodomain-associated transferase 2